MINFSSNNEEKMNVVDAALDWLDKSMGSSATVLVLGGERISVDIRVRILCPFLGDLISSVPCGRRVDEHVVIIPDCHSVAFNHLVSILTRGFTEDCNNPKDVVQLARILNISIKYLESVCVDPDKVNAEADLKSRDDRANDRELEDGEIEDRDEEMSENAGMKVADFSKSFSDVPNIMN